MSATRRTQSASRPRRGRMPKAQLPPWARRRVAPGRLRWPAIILPFFSTPARRSSRTARIALAYVVMALGLNIVVGFAGLLDLGYVAFFAIGAYTRGLVRLGLLRRGRPRQGHPHPRRRPRRASCPGIHVNFLHRAGHRGDLHGDRGHDHRPADAAPARRLHRDRDAGLRRDHRPHRHQRRQHRDQAASRSRPAARASRRSTRSTCRSSAGSGCWSSRPWYYFALVLVAIVLFVNFRLRDSRLGRAWIALREDEVAAVAMGVPSVKTKLHGLRHRRGVRRHRRRVPRLVPEHGQRRPVPVLRSRSWCSAMIILGGLGSIWGVVLGAIALSFINTWFIPDVLNDVPEQARARLRHDADHVRRSTGSCCVMMMILRPQGLIPERRHKMELAEGAETHRRDPLHGTGMSATRDTRSRAVARQPGDPRRGRTSPSSSAA